MSHFTYRKAGGIWSGVLNLTSADMQFFDQNLYKAINGDDGGIWAPTSKIAIGGSGMGVTGNFEAGNNGASLPTFKVYGQNILFVNGASLALDNTSQLWTPGATIKISDGASPQFSPVRSFTDILCPFSIPPPLAGAPADQGAYIGGLIKVPTSSSFGIFLVPPIGAKITTVKLGIIGAGAVAGWPAGGTSSKFGFYMGQTPVSSGSTSSVDGTGTYTVDPSSVYTAYNTYHTISLTQGAGLPSGGVTVQAGYSYVLFFRGDQNSGVYNLITPPFISGTVSELRQVLWPSRTPRFSSRSPAQRPSRGRRPRPRGRASPSRSRRRRCR